MADNLMEEKCALVNEVEPKNDQASPAQSFQPPPYEQVTKEEPKPKIKIMRVTDPNPLPSYTTATELPTYEMSQEMKADEIRQEHCRIFFHTDTESLFDPPKDVGEIDCMFWSAFWLALIFNWIGFFIGYCMLSSLPARCGALAGLGLSIVNCLMYLRASGTCYDPYRVIIWWVLMAIAIVLFLKGIFAGIKLHHEHRTHGRVVVDY